MPVLEANINISIVPVCCAVMGLSVESRVEGGEDGGGGGGWVVERGVKGTG